MRASKPTHDDTEIDAVQAFSHVFPAASRMYLDARALRVLFQDSGVRCGIPACWQGIRWLTYKQEYLRGCPPSLPLSWTRTRTRAGRCICAIRETERERAREKLYALDSQVSGLSRRVPSRRVAAAIAAAAVSLRVTRARCACVTCVCHRGSIYRIRQSTKADLSSSLGLPAPSRCRQRAPRCPLSCEWGEGGDSCEARGRWEGGSN